MKLALGIFVLFIALPSAALTQQQVDCLTQVPLDKCSFLRYGSYVDLAAAANVEIGLAIHIVRHTNGSDGSPAFKDTLLPQIVRRLNSAFQNAKMSFFIVSKDSINNDSFLCEDEYMTHKRESAGKFR